jgi:hypothetical protein
MEGIVSNPRFVAHMLVHWVGPPVAAFDLWEPLRTQLEFDRFDGFDGGDDAEFVYEAAIELLMDSETAHAMRTGDVIVMSLAGELNYYTTNTQDGIEHDMEVDIQWHHFRILPPDEAGAAKDAEFGQHYPAPDQTMTSVPFQTTPGATFSFNVVPGVFTTAQAWYQPHYTKIGSTNV